MVVRFWSPEHKDYLVVNGGETAKDADVTISNWINGGSSGIISMRGWSGRLRSGLWVTGCIVELEL